MQVAPGKRLGTGTSALCAAPSHVGYADNRPLVDALRPVSPDDWLVVAGDVCETVEDLRRTLGGLRERFATVVWAPGNHELWTHPTDPVRPRGRAPGTATKEESLAVARAAGVYARDEFVLHPDPHATREEWRPGPGGGHRAAPHGL